MIDIYICPSKSNKNDKLAYVFEVKKLDSKEKITQDKKEKTLNKALEEIKNRKYIE